MNIHNICKQYGITNYTINTDGSVDVNDSVDLNNKRLTKLPLNFGKVTGHFYCHNNQLTDLEGSPTSVGGTFHCQNNQLTNLEGRWSKEIYNEYPDILTDKNLLKILL